MPDCALCANVHCGDDKSKEWKFELRLTLERRRLVCIACSVRRREHNWKDEQLVNVCIV